MVCGPTRLAGSSLLLLEASTGGGEGQEAPATTQTSGISRLLSSYLLPVSGRRSRWLTMTVEDEIQTDDDDDDWMHKQKNDEVTELAEISEHVSKDPTNDCPTSRLHNTSHSVVCHQLSVFIKFNNLQMQNRILKTQYAFDINT